jgi:hypothetical protein
MSLLKAPLENPSFGMAVTCAVALDFISSMCAKQRILSPMLRVKKSKNLQGANDEGCEEI